MPFTTTLRVEEVEGRDDSWRLIEPLVYHGHSDVFIVPADFVTDFGSVPRYLRWLVPAYGRGKKAYVLHDYLYRSGEVPRDDADGIMRRVMRELRSTKPVRWMAWLGVRVGGGAAWKKYREWSK